MVRLSRLDDDDGAKVSRRAMRSLDGFFFWLKKFVIEILKCSGLFNYVMQYSFQGISQGRNGTAFSNERKKDGGAVRDMAVFVFNLG